MDLWTFDRFRAPRLSVDDIQWDADDDLIILSSGAARYRFAVDDAKAGQRLAADLATLRDSEAPLWAELRQSEPGTPWRAIGTFLDTHSMIAEGWDGAAEAMARQRRYFEETISGTADAILARIPQERHAAASDLAKTLMAEGTRPDPFDAQATPNFFEALASLERDYLAVASPLTAAAVGLLLARIAGTPDEAAAAEAETMLDATAGLYDAHDLMSHLWLIGECIVAGTAEGAPRMPTPPYPELSLCVGLEFMRRVELLTRDTLDLWELNPYVTAIQALGDPASPLVAGPYIEQYHVTRRFVEIVAPLLSRRMVQPLRAIAYRYFGEEVGHEELESATCESLGVTPRALDLAIPLPLHFAFVDMLTQVARTDPIASFAAIMVIEGVFGEPPRMSLRLEAVGAANPEFLGAADEHEALNESLNHNSIARDAFEHIHAVGPARQKQAIDRILFLLELNHRAWAGITDFYGPQASLTLHGPFGTPLDPRA